MPTRQGRLSHFFSSARTLFSVCAFCASVLLYQCVPTTSFVLIMVMFLSVWRIVHVFKRKVREEGVLSILPQFISKALLDLSPLDMLSWLWRSHAPKYLIQLITAPFMGELSADEARWQLQSIPLKYKLKLMRKGVIHTLPPEVQKVLHPLPSEHAMDINALSDGEMQQYQHLAVGAYASGDNLNASGVLHHSASENESVPEYEYVLNGRRVPSAREYDNEREHALGAGAGARQRTGNSSTDPSNVNGAPSKRGTSQQQRGSGAQTGGVLSQQQQQQQQFPRKRINSSGLLKRSFVEDECDAPGSDAATHSAKTAPGGAVPPGAAVSQGAHASSQAHSQPSTAPVLPHKLEVQIEYAPAKRRSSDDPAHSTSHGENSHRGGGNGGGNGALHSTSVPSGSSDAQPFITQASFAANASNSLTQSQQRWARIDTFVKQVKKSFAGARQNSTIQHVRGTLQTLNKIQELANKGLLHSVDAKRLIKYFVYSSAFLLVFACVHKKSRKWLRLWSAQLVAGAAFLLATGSLGLYVAKRLEQRVQRQQKQLDAQGMLHLQQAQSQQQASQQQQMHQQLKNE